MMFMAHMQRAGHRPIASWRWNCHIGDPSGRTDMRQMLTKRIEHNGCIKTIRNFIDFSDSGQY